MTNPQTPQVTDEMCEAAWVAHRKLYNYEDDEPLPRRYELYRAIYLAMHSAHIITEDEQDSLGARWLPMETSPHAMHFLAAYYDYSVGDWLVGIVMRGQNINDPWTHWMPLPELPALAGETRRAETENTGSVEDEHATAKPERPNNGSIQALKG